MVSKPSVPLGDRNAIPETPRQGGSMTDMQERLRRCFTVLGNFARANANEIDENADVETGPGTMNAAAHAASGMMRDFGNIARSLAMAFGRGEEAGARAMQAAAETLEQVSVYRAVETGTTQPVGLRATRDGLQVEIEERHERLDRLVEEWAREHPGESLDTSRLPLLRLIRSLQCERAHLVVARDIL